MNKIKNLKLHFTFWLWVKSYLVSVKKKRLVTPMYRWDLYECDTMNVQKGLGFCLRFSFSLYCHG